MSDLRDFHLGDVLSITTGRLVSPRHMDGVYDILGFMTGETLWTHQLPRAAEECRPILLSQHPALAEIVPPEAFNGKAHVEEWLAEQVAQYGEQISVSPLSAREPQYDTPIADAIEMVGDPTKVMVVEP